MDFDSEGVPETCFDGKSRGQVSLEFITQMWEVYENIPKFAYLNALAAHDYSLDAAHASLSAEKYDQDVHAFLSNIMTRKDARDTIILLRSDHGLQG